MMINFARVFTVCVLFVLLFSHAVHGSGSSTANNADVDRLQERVLNTLFTGEHPSVTRSVSRQRGFVEGLREDLGTFAVKEGLKEIVTAKQLSDIHGTGDHYFFGEKVGEEKKNERLVSLQARVLYRLMQTAPGEMDFRALLKTVIEENEHAPGVRIRALQTLLRRHPTIDTQRYVFEQMKNRLEHWRKKREGRQLASLAARN